MDGIRMKLPFYGIRRIRDGLLELGFTAGRRHVATLMRKMGIEALHPKRRLSAPHPGHRIYPYLLRGVHIKTAGHVRRPDITYLPMARGFCYLVAIMDRASRRVLSWRLSNTLDASFCIEALEEALHRYGAPTIFNTDQGPQFTSEGFTGTLHPHGVAISMDGRGRWMDNVFIERLWRSVKYEEVYLKGYESITEARRELAACFGLPQSPAQAPGARRQDPGPGLLVYTTDRTVSCLKSDSSPKNQTMLSRQTRPPLRESRGDSVPSSQPHTALPRHLQEECVPL